YQRVSDSYDTPLNAMDGMASYAELERDTLHWARVQQDWVFRPTQPTQRLVCKRFAHMHLVLGGRWLLTNAEDLCLDFYDLDSLNIQRRTLIRSQDKRDERVRIFVVDEARTTPSNVDMQIALSHEAIHDPFVRLSIWRITSAPDDTLIAHHITSFNTYTTADDAPRHIDVYDWQRSSSLVHHKATIVIGPQVVANVRILPRQQILAFKKDIVQIYAIDASEFRPTSGKRPVNGAPTMPLHTIILPGMNPYSLCPIQVDLLGNASMYLDCARAMVKLTIPYDDRPPTVVDYLTYNTDSTWTRVLTSHRAYFRRGTTGRAVLLARGYDERCNQIWEVEGRNYDRGPLLDDYSGRIVERARMNFETVVFLRSYDSTCA
ncbi:hypothetical protein AB1N83_013317, partial [Pleurotus pulmonarius]